jgi:hypothetical protein
MPATVGRTAGSNPAAPAADAVTRATRSRAQRQAERCFDVATSDRVYSQPSGRLVTLRSTGREDAVLKDLWMRVTGRHHEKEAERDQEYEHMSPEEKRFQNESVEDRAARIETDAHFGAFDAEDVGEDDAP